MSKYILPYLLSFVFGLSSLVSAGIIQVPQDQPSIQAGINAAANGDTVLVGDSTYYENINFNGKAITVASYYIIDGDTTHRDSTIINGSQPTNPDIGSVVSFVSGEDTNSVICGFTIIGGTGTLYDSNTRVGGGIYCRNSGARILHNKIIFNSVTSDLYCNGGGIGHYPRSNLKYVIIEDNIIASNTLNSLVGTGGAGANGAGIFLTQGRIIHNKITLNTCSGQTHGIGGGIRVMCEPTSARTFVKISRNTITNNEATSVTDIAVGGGIDVTLSNVEIDSNQISHNTVSGIKAYGGGIRMEFSQAISIAKDNIISHNSCLNGPNRLGGGLLLAATNGVTIQGNQFTNNTAALGGGINEQQTIGSIICGNIFDGNIADSDGGGIMSIWDTTNAIYNNLFVNNKAVQSGGGIYLYPNSSVQIINNTIVADTAGSFGGGIFSGSDSVIVMNTILWGNSGFEDLQIYTGGTNTQVVYCDVQGLIIGEGNINADPLFVPGDSLFHLTDSSPCVNTGADSIQINGQWYYCPPDDYEGEARPFPGTPPDMGADETDALVGVEPRPVTGVPGSYALYQNYPNPFNPSTTIEFQIPNTEFVTIKIYNLLGQEVSTLVSDKLVAGNYKITWDATGFSSGVYLYRLESGNFIQIKKMLLIQ